MNDTDFIRRYGGIYERSPWVAEAAAGQLTVDDDVEAIARVMADCVDKAAADKQLELLCAHPDLAGRLRVGEQLTADSSDEQASAGLDRCTPEEYAKFQSLNRAYREKFGFPFIMAVRGKSRGEILAQFETRLANDRAAEFETALLEVHKIARLRLQALGDAT